MVRRRLIEHPQQPSLPARCQVRKGASEVGFVLLSKFVGLVEQDNFRH
jgi:hypothetical protein